MKAGTSTVSISHAKCYVPTDRLFLQLASDIRKQQEVLQESYMMVPDSKSRLRDAIEELSNLVVRQIRGKCFGFQSPHQ